MSLIECIKNNFNRGFFGKAMRIEELPENYPAWTIKRDNWIGVAVPIESPFLFSERFANVRIKTANQTEIENKIYDLLLLICDNMELRNEFAVICSQFVEPGLQGKERHNLISNPEEWWKHWKCLLGNVTSSLEPYPVLGELIVLERLISDGKKPVWTGFNNATHDIELSNRSYEVKSTIARYGYEVTISSVYQMKSSGDKLDLIFCRFEHSLLGRSIDEVVQSLISSGYPEENLEKILNNMKLEKGCTARAIKYKLLEMNNYSVDNEFPLITVNSFKEGGLPENIVKFTYTIDLSGVKCENIL